MESYWRVFLAMKVVHLECYINMLLRNIEGVTRVLEERREERVAFIVEGNTAPEALFSKLGGERTEVNKKKQTGKRRARRKWIKR